MVRYLLILANMLKSFRYDKYYLYYCIEQIVYHTLMINKNKINQVPIIIMY